MGQASPSSTLGKALIVLGVVAGVATMALASLAWIGVKRYRQLRADQENIDSRLTPESDYDATTDVVDEDYRFRLRWPGPGTRMMRADDARKLSSDAVAAAFDEGGCYGVVIVESVPGAQLDPMADLIIKSMAVQERSDEVRSRGTVAGKEAVRYGLTGLVGGGKIRYEGAVFVHQDHVYQLVTWRPAAAVRDCATWLTSSFTLLEGTVKGRAMAATPDQQGIGWRVRAGAWSDAPYRLALDPPDGFRVVVGEDLAAMNKRALVGMSSRAPQAHMLVFVDPASPTDKSRSDALLREFAATVDTTVTDEAIPLTVGGEPVAVHPLASNKDTAFEFVGGLLVRNGWRIEVIGWYGALDRDRARPKVLAAFQGIRFLGDEDAESLGRELLAGPDPQVLITEQAVVRGGVYRDFGYGLTLAKPKGFWEMSFEWTPLATAHARVTALGHGTRITAFLEVEDQELSDTSVSQRELVARLVEGSAASMKPRPRDVAPMIPRGLRASYDIQTADGVWRYDVTSGSRDGRAAHVVVFGRREDMAAADEAVTVLSNSLAFGVAGLDPVRWEGNRLTDLRLGFEMSAPDASWVSTPLPTSYGMKEVVDARMWTKGDEAISVVAVHAGADQDGEHFIVGLMEQEVARRIGKGNPGIPQRGETTLCGRQARQLTWVGPTKVDVVFTTRSGTTYAILFARRVMGGTELEVVKRGLRLLD